METEVLILLAKFNNFILILFAIFEMIYTYNFKLIIKDEIKKI